MIEKGKWIWANVSRGVNQYVDFIRDFALEDISSDAILEICADKEYVVWLNGHFAGCGQYNDHSDNKNYDSLSVGKYLRKGKNRLCITGYYQGEDSLQYEKSVRGIRFALVCGKTAVLSDETVLAALSVTMKSGEIHKTTNQLGYNFEVDLSADDQWIMAEKAPSRFQNAVCKDFATNLVPRRLKKLDIGEKCSAKVIAQGVIKDELSEANAACRMQNTFLSHRLIGDVSCGDSILPGELKFKASEENGYYIVIDMHKETVGYFSMDLELGEKTLVDVGYGEHLEDLRVRTSISERNFAFSIICAEGRNTFTNCFRRIAGRYIQLHIHTGKPFVLKYAGVLPAEYPIEKTGVFRCNDHLHNKIYEVCIDTLKNCMHEHYEDCPWREQALYTSDSRNQMLCGYYLFDDFSFQKQSLELLCKSFEEDGFQKICGVTDEKKRIPSFTFIWFLQIKEYTRYTRDLYFVDNYWNTIENVFEKYTANMTDGMAVTPRGENYWNFYEWSKGHVLGGEELDAIKNSSVVYDGLYQIFLSLALGATLDVAKECGKTDFIEKYTPVLCKIKETVNKVFWDEEKKLYAAYVADGMKYHFSELTQVLALYTGIAQGEKATMLRETISQPNDLIKITLSYSIYKYEVLLEEKGKYEKYVFDNIAERWGRMLYCGATSFWETDGGAEDFGQAGSLCHGWSAFPLYMYYRYVMGVTADNLNNEGEFDGRRIFAEFYGQVKTGQLEITAEKKEGLSPEYQVKKRQIK